MNQTGGPFQPARLEIPKKSSRGWIMKSYTVPMFGRSKQAALKQLYQHRPQIAKNNFCVINVENSLASAKS